MGYVPPRLFSGLSYAMFMWDKLAINPWRGAMLDHVAILLAEDDKDEVFLMRRGLEKAGVPNPLFVVENGREVIDYLAGNGQFSSREKYPLPGLMLLDLKMPWMDGFDVLAWLRTKKQFDTLPVVVLTSSKLQ